MNEVSMKFAILSSSIWFDSKIVSMCPRSDAKSVIQRTKSCYLARLTPNISHKLFEIKKILFYRQMYGSTPTYLVPSSNSSSSRCHVSGVWRCSDNIVFDVYSSLYCCILVFLYTCRLVYIYTCILVCNMWALLVDAVIALFLTSIFFFVFSSSCILVYLYILFSLIVEYWCIFTQIFN